MKVDISWQGVMKFEGANPEGQSLLMDAGPEVGGEGKGPRPTEVLLMGLGGCMGINVLSILKKMRETVTAFHMNVDGDRSPAEPKRFTQIRLFFQFEGEMRPANVERAIKLSLEKYCSVSNSLNAQMSFAYEINGVRYTEAFQTTANK